MSQVQTCRGDCKRAGGDWYGIGYMAQTLIEQPCPKCGWPMEKDTRGMWVCGHCGEKA